MNSLHGSICFFGLLLICFGNGCGPQRPTTSVPTPAEGERPNRGGEDAPNDPSSNLSILAAPAGDTTEKTTPRATDQSEVVDTAVTVEAAERLAAEGQIDGASELVTKLLVRDATEPRVLFLAARLAAERGELADAIELLSAIATDAPQYLPAVGQTADWSLALKRYDVAEAKYLEILDAVPEFAVAHRRLAELYNRQGKRQLAAQHIRQLCRLGNVQESELHALISVPDAFFQSGRTDVDDPLGPIGTLGRARIEYTKGEISQAAERMQVASEGQLDASEHAFWGRTLAESQAFDRLPLWLSKQPEGSLRQGDFWFTVGSWMLWERKTDLAIESFCRAIRLVPTDRVAHTKLAECLRLNANQSDAAKAFERAKQLNEVQSLSNAIGLANPPRPELYEEMSKRLLALDRPLEAIMWRAAGLSKWASPQEQQMAITKLNLQRKELVNADPIPSGAHLPEGLQNIPERNDTPEWFTQLPKTPNTGSEANRQPKTGIASFRNVAKSAGIDEVYLNDEKQNHQMYQLHQQIGGGVAVFDYDLDGRADLYFTQGASNVNFNDLDHWQGQQPNQLFRGRSGSFVNATEDALTDDRGFGQGVTAGDFNCDGFPDLYIANIGQNRLLINNGDGTYRDASEAAASGRGYWTSCVAIADVNGDSLPDLIECNYVDGRRAFELPAEVPNATVQDDSHPKRFYPRPIEFDAALDRIFLSDGQGATQLIELNVNEGGDVCDALALLVTNIDGKPGNDLFIANDMRTNHLWLASPEDESADPADIGGLRFRETGVLSGVAHDFRGDTNACMGIAAADFDENGLLDLVVTNFYHESMNFFVQREPGVFADLAGKSKLFDVSYGFNGFGIQSLDYDNNGWIDLAVLNGHIHDARHRGEPFRMRPQLLDGSSGTFKDLTFESPTGYFETAALGRSLAKLDWNRDGKIDLVATHLDLPHALLENQTKESGNTIQLRLIGTNSERDAVGASVWLDIGDRQYLGTVTTGDGFQCKNESFISAGLGSADSVDLIRIAWPSGLEQRFNSVPGNARYLVVEGEDQLIQQFEFDGAAAD